MSERASELASGRLAVTPCEIHLGYVAVQRYSAVSHMGAHGRERAAGRKAAAEG